MAVRTGNDIISREAERRLGRSRVGLLANPASVASNLVHISDSLSAHRIRLDCIFGPQHGYRGETQANMIEWQGYIDPELGIPVYSLYGEKREPDAFMVQDLDTLIVDLPDVGARPYTYLWTAYLMMKACAAAGVRLLVCDRPNPIGGRFIEGPMLDESYRSFVGLHPLPMRHGLTIGEALHFMNETEGLGCGIEVIRMRGWERSMHFDETGQPWIMPSPNMPSPETALLYPGMVMLEGTNISEGRGTTRPFELVGAPWIEPQTLAQRLSSRGIEGARFRPVYFEPAWDKHEGKLCGGVQIHVTKRKSFRPVRCGALLIATVAELYPDDFAWSEPPYEYEYERPPIDIIFGGPSLREAIDAGEDIETLFDGWKRAERNFSRKRKPFLLY